MDLIVCVYVNIKHYLPYLNPGYSKPRLSRIQVNLLYSSYAKIRLMRREIKGFGMNAPEILSEICEEPIYASPTHARFIVDRYYQQG